VSAASAAAFTPLFADARAAGTTLVRLQLTQGFGYDTLGIDRTGAVLASWAASWDAVLDEAQRQGLNVIPVFAIWGDWNDGTPPLGWVHFNANPLGSARGGPAASPAELFTDSEAQRAWLGWLSALVSRWSSRPNIAAWEVFSELDLATGATEPSATAFVERAREAIAGSDPWSRPAFASTSDLPLLSGQPWKTLWASPGNDIVAIHPYDPELDRQAVARTQSVWQLSDKPVLIGESGLDAAPPEGGTLTSAPNARVGLENAIWAELVSGAASARALYWEDGYAAYYPATGLPLVNALEDLEQRPASWLVGKDFSDLVPLSVSGEPPVFGTAVGSSTRVLGWVRNDLLAPPAWDAPAVAAVEVRVSLPEGTPDASWAVALTDGSDGTPGDAQGSSTAAVLSFVVERPLRGTAFVATLVAGSERPPGEPARPAEPACPSASTPRCRGDAYQLVLDGTSVFSDPDCPPLPVDINGTECRGHVDFSLNSCSHEELALPSSCVDVMLSDIREQLSGSANYYDATGTLTTLEVTAIDFAFEPGTVDTLAGGTLRGTVLRDGATEPWSLAFRGCNHGLVPCLL
jgi:hypothetical protein